MCDVCGLALLLGLVPRVWSSTFTCEQQVRASRSGGCSQYSGMAGAATTQLGSLFSIAPDLLSAGVADTFSGGNACTWWVWAYLPYVQGPAKDPMSKPWQPCRQPEEPGGTTGGSKRAALWNESGATCLTCGIGVSSSGFETPEDQRIHFKTDWHRLNVRRRVARQDPLTEDQFEQLLEKGSDVRSLFKTTSPHPAAQQGSLASATPPTPRLTPHRYPAFQALMMSQRMRTRP